VNFKEWMKEEFEFGELEDIATYGARGGYRHLTWNSDIERLYDRFEGELWNILALGAQEFDRGNALDFLGTMNGAESVCGLVSLKSLIVWYAAEEAARQLVEEAVCDD